MELEEKKIKAPEASAFPERIALELTPLCNLACSMCPRHYIKAGDGYMKEYLWRKLVDEIKAASPDAIILPFWRGESLLHPDFSGLMNYALDRGLRMHLCTNGELMTDEHAAIMARMEFVTFSVHTPGGFEKAGRFLAFKKGEKPAVQVSFVAGEPSAGNLKKIVSDSGLAGFDSVRLYEEHSKDGVFGKSNNKPAIARVFCRKLVDTLAVAYDGTVSRCNHVWETEKGMNVNDSAIKQAWNSARLKEIRKNYPDDRCALCDQWTGHTVGEAWRRSDDGVVHMVFK